MANSMFNGRLRVCGRAIEPARVATIDSCGPPRGHGAPRRKA
ncbi:hypothetical protein ACFPRL_23750 [Pseudoclavibacter helvolus]